MFYSVAIAQTSNAVYIILLIYVNHFNISQWSNGFYFRAQNVNWIKPIWHFELENVFLHQSKGVLEQAD